jgi:hypothetical protein
MNQPKTWSELLDNNPPAPSLRGAEDLVIGSSRSEPGSMTRLEAAEQERRSLMLSELNKHRDNIDAELSRHRQAMEHIASVFGVRLSVA